MTAERRAKDRLALVVALGITVLVSAVAVYVWDAWILNFDGSGYLTLSRALRASGTYRFPDGSFATFRGPGFPAFLALGQLVVGGSIKSAVWIARSVLIINAALLALLVWRASRDALAAAIAGVTVAVMPWTFVSGATSLVPDALAAGLVLAGLVTLWSNSYRMHVVAGVLLGVAVLTKEIAVFGLLAALLVVLVRTGSAALASGVITGFTAPLVLWWIVALSAAGHLPAPFEGVGGAAGWLVAGLLVLGSIATLAIGRTSRRTVVVPSSAAAGALALLPILTFGALIVGVGRLPGDDRGLLEALGDGLLQELYQGTSWWVVLLVAVLATLWAARSLQSPLAFTGLALLGVGAGATLYAAVGRFGIRNGVLASYGIAILVGFAVSSTKRVQLVRFGVIVAAAALFAGNLQATGEVDDRSADPLVTEQNAVTAAASDFLSSRPPGKVLATASSAAAVSFQTASGMEFALLPMYVSPDPTWPQELDHLVHWLAQAPASQPVGTEPIAISTSSNRITAVDELLVLEALSGADYVMLTGNARFNGSPFDGGVLLPFFDAAPSAARVWAEINEDAQWIVIYEISHPFVGGDVDPVYRSVDGALIDGNPSLDLVEYSELVKSLVAAQ
ncbi:MAG: hypothetical protein KJO18_01510 [Acidimicrobiia bacterium]|nr:hypothetical protein [Acidimicrobiia bacterium]